jgi:putative ATP-binding cassette transporter
MVMVAMLAAIANALVLAIVNVAAGSIDRTQHASLRLAIGFAVVLIVFTFSQRYMMFEASAEIERIVHRIRCRLIEAVRTSELAEVDELGRTHIFAVVGQQAQTLSQTCNLLIPSVQMALLVVFTTLYLISLSTTAFILAACFMAVAIAMYLARTSQLDRAAERASQAEYQLTDLLAGVLEGFKEGKLNSRRSAELADDAVAASGRASRERTHLQNEFARNYIFTQNVFFLLLGTMVFIVPELSSVTSGVLVKTTTAVLFVFGPIAGVVSAIPTFSTANSCAAQIIALES